MVGCVLRCHHPRPLSSWFRKLPNPCLTWLQVRVGGKWGTVCGTGFNQAAAQVVCRKLNMTGGKPRYGAVYGKGKLPILLSNLRCRGGESELSACLFSASTKQCTHANDVGVACKREWQGRRTGVARRC